MKKETNLTSLLWQGHTNPQYEIFRGAAFILLAFLLLEQKRKGT